MATVRDPTVPPFDAPDGSPAEEIVRRATGLNSAGTLAFVTEASLFARAGFPAVICGPGDIAQAHQPDEFLSVAEFEAGWRFMEGVVADLCTRGALA